jgi:hypothetical protein
MFNKLSIKSFSLISAISVALAAFLLPATICSPGSEINACCAANKCDTAMVLCLCCQREHKSTIGNDEKGLPSLSNSVPLSTTTSILKVSPTLLSSLPAVQTINPRTLTAFADEAKPSRLYLLNCSLLI